MPLTHTTTIPDGDADAVLNSANTIKIIVIGSDRLPLVQKADAQANHPPLAVRKVLWFKNGLPHPLATKYILKSNCVAFVLNVNNDLKDQILSNENIDTVRINQAYVKGAAQ